MRTKMTAAMQSSLVGRLADLDRKIDTLRAGSEDDDSLEVLAMLNQLSLERHQISEALEQAVLIDDDPFDTEAIEIGDTVTIRDPEGGTDSYVLVDRNVRSRARSDWVSVGSPLGAALLGRSKGDHVYVESPGGMLSYFIVDFVRAADGSVLAAISDDPEDQRGPDLLPSEAFAG